MKRGLALALLVAIATGCDMMNSIRGDGAVVARAGAETLTVRELAQTVGASENFPLDTAWVEMAAWWWVEASLVLQRFEQGDSLLDSATVRATRWPDAQQATLDAFYEERRTSVPVHQVDSAYAAGDLRVLDQILLRVSPGTSDAQRRATGRRAESLRSRIVAGMSWELANEQNEDLASKPFGGRIGVVTWGGTVPEFERIGFALQPGEVSAVFESEHGFHIVRRPLLDEVRSILGTAVRDTLFLRFRSDLLYALLDERRVEIREAAPDLLRQAALVPNRAKTWDDIVATWSDGMMRMPELVQWLQMLPPELMEQISESVDAELVEIARDIVSYRLEYDALRDSVGTLDEAVFRQMRARLASDLEQWRWDVGAELALLSDGGRGSTRGLALRDIATWMADTRTERRAQVPAFLADRLRDEFRWRVYFDLMPLVSERAREVREGSNESK